MKAQSLKIQIAVSALLLVGFTAAIGADAPESFKKLCTSCHGPGGEGKKPMGPPLKGSEFIKGASEADIKKTIQNGRAGGEKRFKEFPSPMPPQKQLPDAELDALVKYLKGLNPSSTSTAPVAEAKTVSPPPPAAPEPAVTPAPAPATTAKPAQDNCEDCHKKK